MAIQVITSDDLQRFREELLNDIKNIFQKHAPEPYKKWLKSDEVRKLLKVSPGTLQTLRINGTLKFTKLGGILFYDYDHIQKTFTDNLQNSI
jgi:hypothetical protein